MIENVFKKLALIVLVLNGCYDVVVQYVLKIGIQ